MDDSLSSARPVAVAVCGQFQRGTASCLDKTVGYIVFTIRRFYPLRGIILRIFVASVAALKPESLA